MEADENLGMYANREPLDPIDAALIAVRPLIDHLPDPDKELFRIDKELHQAYGGAAVYIGLSPRKETIERLVRLGLKNGNSARSLAMFFGKSVRQIQRIASERP